jgi:hypothetical protein
VGYALFKVTPRQADGSGMARPVGCPSITALDPHEGALPVYVCRWITEPGMGRMDRTSAEIVAGWIGWTSWLRRGETSLSES